MSFEVNTLTLKGAELLATATAQDRLVIVGCDADTQVYTQQQAIEVSNRVLSPVSTSTEVTQLSSVDRAIYARAYFKSGVTSGGNVNSLYLYGHLESDSTNDFVIYVVSNTDAFHLPQEGDTIDEWETRFEINYRPTAGSIFFATQATYATQSELEQISACIVTTHSVGFPSEGDNQTILGDKTYLGKTDLKGGAVGISPYIDVSNELVVPIGGIVMVWFPATNSAGEQDSDKVGDPLLVTSNSLYVAKNENGTLVQGSVYIPAGEYVFLMENKNQTGDTWSFLMRIS